MMHDWTLTTILYEWKTAKATLCFLGPLHSAVIVAEGVSHLDVPHENDWGPSVSVNEVRGLTGSGDRRRLEIEMQSGDVIAITARSFALPDPVSNMSTLAKAGAK
jgi:hypothetical protein